MNNKFSLQTLDEYAKTLSSKQVNMLYESKCGKSYKKKLFEHMKYQGDNYYRLYLDNFVMNENNLNKDKVLARYVSQYNLQYNVTNEGVYLYTPDPMAFICLNEQLIKDGVSKETLMDILDNPAILKQIKIN